MVDLRELLEPSVKQQLGVTAWLRLRERKKREALASRAAKQDGLLEFIQYTKNDYKPGWFHRELCLIMQRFLAAVMAGERPRYAISAPPQHGKSEIVSRKFPCWAQGLHPELRFVCSSYNSPWAEQLSGDRLKVLQSPEYREVFQNAPRLAVKRAGYLENTADGFMMAAGVDAGISGRSSDIGLIDDPIAGYREAMSEATRAKLKNWYRTDFYTRLQQGAGILLMQTRWHEDDLVGWLIEEAKEGGDPFILFNFPAIAEHDEEFRHKGEALTVERFNLSALAAIKRVQGSYAWSALYQGAPAPAEGLMLKRDYWRYYTRRPDGTWDLPSFDLIVVSLDAAFKSNPTSDHVAIHVWGFVGPRGYLIDRTCEQMGYVATKAEATRLSLKHKAATLLIEDAANGAAVIEELSRNLGGAVTVIGIAPAGGKIARAWPFSADLEAGNAWLPEGEFMEVVDYAASFPNTSMDHDIDAMTQAFNWRRENMHGLFAYMEAEANKAKKPAAAGLAKVVVAPQTPVCPNDECRSLAVRMNPDGSGRCNQCGQSWASPDGDENAELGGGPSRGNLLK
jgi:predicted phage terminase large subunit-like protein